MINLVVILLLNFSGWSLATAGPSTSGGGFAVVCYDADQKIKSAELFDFFEAREQFGQNIIEHNDNLDKILKQKQEILSRSGYQILEQFSYTVTSFMEKLRFNLKFTSEHATLKIVPDLSEVVIPAKCNIVQAATFYSPGYSIIESQIWNAMNEQNRAGLILHELIYQLDKSIGDHSDSRRVRRVVSELFSSNQIQSTVNQAHDIACSSRVIGDPFTSDKNLTFFTVSLKSPIEKFSIVQFYALNGNPVLSQKKCLLGENFPLLGTSQKANTFCQTLSHFEGYDLIQITTTENGVIISGKTNTYPIVEIAPTPLRCWSLKK